MIFNLALVEDNPQLRSRFEDYFTLFPDIVLVGSYASGEAAVNGVKTLPPSKLPRIILMDIELPKISGIEATAILKDHFPEIDIIMLTVFEDQNRILQSIQAGASGYLLKDEPPEVIMGSLEECMKGGAPISQGIARKVLGMLRLPGHQGKKLPDEVLELSEREVELLRGLVDGETYITLADKLFISPHTVRTHIRNIYKRLHVHSRAQAVKLAIEKRLI